MGKTIRGKNIKYVIYMLFICIFALMLFLNFKTTFVADDFNNMFYHNLRITKISEVIESQKYRYYNTNGRVLAHLIGGCLLIYPKFIINILNSLCFCIMVLLMYKFVYLGDDYISAKKRKKGKAILAGYLRNNVYKISVIMMIFLSIWRFTPYFGQDFLWVIGSANYMWTATIVLFSLLIARSICVYNKPISSNIIFTLYIVLFFLAGSTNENTVPGFFIVLGYYIYHMYKDKRDNFIFLIFMGVSSLAGYLIMITAPGNFVRLGAYIREPKGIEKYFFRLSNMNEKFIKYFLLLFIIVVIINIISKFIYKNKENESVAFFIAGLASFYSMVMSPTFPERAMFITVAYFIISLILCFSLIASKNWYTYVGLMAVILLYLFIFFFNTFGPAKDGLEKYQKDYNERAINIWHNLYLGRKDEIHVDKIKTKNTFVPAYGLEDCEDNPKHWINVTISRYYGVNSITTKDSSK